MRLVFIIMTLKSKLQAISWVTLSTPTCIKLGTQKSARKVMVILGGGGNAQSILLKDYNLPSGNAINRQ